MSEPAVLDRPSPSPGENLTLRNSDLNTLFDMLTAQAAKAADIVVPAAQLRADAARLSIPGSVPHIDDDGVTLLDGLFVPTRHAEAQIADKLKIPLEYLRRLRTDAPGLWEANVGHWLEAAGNSGKSYLLRLLVDPKHGGGVLRALLSSRYGIIDNLDVLLCALDGIRAAGVDVEVTSCDLSETRMYVTVVAPQIAVAAPGLLAGYRSPFDPSRTGENMPIINAGFRFSNSEAGPGSTPSPRGCAPRCAATGWYRSWTRSPERTSGPSWTTAPWTLRQPPSPRSRRWSPPRPPTRSSTG